MTIWKGNIRTLLGASLLLVPIASGCGEEAPVGEIQQSVHDDNLFELDGNAQDEPAPGDDWDTVLLEGGGSSTSTTGLLVDPDEATIFTTGGSKDIHDVSEWLHKSGNVPPKDDLLHAFAASYSLNGDPILYFGADRYAVNGDAQMGFWFFQNAIGLNADGTFSGVHADGDILVLSHFTNGGKVASISVYEWVGAGTGSDGNLNLLASGTVVGGGASSNLFCLPDDSACAAVNDAIVPSPWPFVPKFGDPNFFPVGAFMEGGIDLGKLLGEGKCFSSFLAETRASQSLDAVLKDFVLGPLDTCKPPKKPEICVKKCCEVFEKACVEPPSFNASFNATVTNCGEACLPAGTVITVVDDAGTAGDTSDDVEVSTTLSDTLDPGESVDLSGQFQTQENPPLYNVVHATADTGTVTLEASSEPTACTTKVDEQK